MATNGVRLHRLAAGKRVELKVAAELIAYGLDVYTPYVDTLGIDLVVRVSGPGGPHYYDIQIKSAQTPGFNGIYRTALESHSSRYLLVLAYFFPNQTEEYYYLTKEQVLGLLPAASDGHGNLAFNKAHRDRFKTQGIAALAHALTTGAL